MLDEVLAAGPERVGQAFYDRARKQQASGGAGLDRAADLVCFLVSGASDGITGKLISAIWDPWAELARASRGPRVRRVHAAPHRPRRSRAGLGPGLTPAMGELPPVCILAGGKGTRLGVHDRPKPLVEVAGEPFLFHPLRLLRAHGARRVVLCVDHLGEQIADAVGDGSQFGLDATVVFDAPGFSGTAGAVRGRARASRRRVPRALRRHVPAHRLPRGAGRVACVGPRGAHDRAAQRGSLGAEQRRVRRRRRDAPRQAGAPIRRWSGSTTASAC